MKNLSLVLSIGKIFYMKINLRKKKLRTMRKAKLCYIGIVCPCENTSERYDLLDLEHVVK